MTDRFAITIETNSHHEFCVLRRAAFNCWDNGYIDLLTINREARSVTLYGEVEALRRALDMQDHRLLAVVATSRRQTLAVCRTARDHAVSVLSKLINP